MIKLKHRKQRYRINAELDNSFHARAQDVLDLMKSEIVKQTWALRTSLSRPFYQLYFRPDLSGLV